MASPILATKLFVPQTRRRLVHRDRLIQQLSEGLRRRLTLLSAPAGFGKTTLLSDWHASRTPEASPAVAWVSLDKGDNDPVRFLTYLMAALQTVEAQLGVTAQAMLQSPQSPPLESVLTALINDVTTVRDPFVLVLDDYDLIEAATVHDAVTFLVDHMPPQMRLVLTSRVDPPLPLARLRARGELSELRMTDLRFTSQEVKALLVDVLGLEPSAAAVAALETRTEGWVAGLQLAVLSMQGREDIDTFIQAFTGNDRYIVDYLTEEVLQRQSPATQDFLLHTSILERLSEPLCAVVTGQANLQDQLEYLEQANLFIIPLDNQRRWYRYHHLFAQLLRYRLQRLYPEQVPGLHQRASQWFEQHGFIEDAIHHALAASDFERAAQLVVQASMATMSRGEVNTVLEWLSAFPDDFIHNRPRLCTLYAAALTFSYQPERADAWLQDAVRGVTALPAEETRAILGQVAVIRAAQARIPGDITACIRFAEQALELLPETDVFWRGPAAAYAGLAYRLSGDVTPNSERVMEEAVTLARASGNLIAILNAVTNLARLRTIQGRLRKAAATYQEIWQWAADKDELWILVGSPSYYIGMGNLLREWNELDRAERHLAQGLEMSKWIVDAEVITWGYTALAGLKQAQGDLRGALDTLAGFHQLAQQRSFAPRFIALAEAAQVPLWLAQGDLERASTWAEHYNVAGCDVRNYPREHEYLALARVCIAQQRAPDALGLLDQLLAVAEAGEQMWSAIEILVLRALAYQSLGDEAQALAALERAFKLAEPEGYVRVFVDEGPPMARLLRSARAAGVDPPYASRLLAVLADASSGRRPGTDGDETETAWPLGEALSTREAAVLKLLVAGASSPEIASKLFVSVSTVRSHIKNIYSKLGVHSRDQAIDRARQLNLV